uniref:Uncharacterized protein n=1 Tax=Strigamia maritima TaxID=126957 RepID=T1JI73_STRMM
MNSRFHRGTNGIFLRVELLKTIPIECTFWSILKLVMVKRFRQEKDFSNYGVPFHLTTEKIFKFINAIDMISQPLNANVTDYLDFLCTLAIFQQLSPNT